MEQPGKVCRFRPKRTVRKNGCRRTDEETETEDEIELEVELPVMTDSLKKN